jgi:hypothetical protein
VVSCEHYSMLWDFKFSRRRFWCSELSSGLYCLHGSTTQKTALNIITACCPFSKKITFPNALSVWEHFYVWTILIWTEINRTNTPQFSNHALACHFGFIHEQRLSPRKRRKYKPKMYRFYKNFTSWAVFIGGLQFLCEHITKSCIIMMPTCSM